MDRGTVAGDQSGVHLSGGARGGALSIAWDQIHAVVAYKLDCIEYEALMIDLEHENGDFVSLDASTPGFEAAAEAMVRHLPGLEPIWMERARATSVEAEPLVLWQRG